MTITTTKEKKTMPTRRILSALAASLLAAVTLAAAGCEREAPKQEEQPTGYAVVNLTIYPDPAVALKPTRLVATVTDRDGAPVTGASVVFDLSMPGMYHGENRPEAREAMPGVYEAPAIMTMGGRWLIAVEVRGKGLFVKDKFYTDAKSK